MHLQLPPFNPASRPTQPPTTAYQQLLPSSSSNQPITSYVPLLCSQQLSQPTLPVQSHQLQLPQLQQAMAIANPLSGTTFFFSTAAFNGTVGS